MTNACYEKDKVQILNTLNTLPKKWDGRQCILALKERDYNWRQMEWMGWYFEILCRDLLSQNDFDIPGKKYGNIGFDSFRTINWDMKTSAIKSKNHRIILNDKTAIESSVSDYGFHGIIMALVNVEYDNNSRSFQKWHTELKGGLSDYERERISRNAKSRFRKTSADLKQILLLVINQNTLKYLDIHRQGRNSDGSGRNTKYMLNMQQVSNFEVGRIDF